MNLQSADHPRICAVTMDCGGSKGDIVTTARNN